MTALVWHSSFASLTGYSGSARAFVLGLDARGIPVHPLFIYGANYEEQVIAGGMHPRIRQLQSLPLSLAVPQVVYAPGDRLSKNSGSYRIGFTMLEVDRLPASWVEQANQMDEVWTPSEWGAGVFRSSGVQRPVHVVPLGVDTSRFYPSAPRTRLSDRTIFLSIFEWGARKGWETLLRAYTAAFRSSDPVLLVLKVDCRTPAGNPLREMAELLEEAGPDQPPITLLYNQPLSSAQLLELYQSADCFVLPTRGEGWGMPILEAMACGVPAIATDWSAPTAFLSEANGYPLPIRGLVPTGQRSPYYRAAAWADPDQEALVELLRRVAREPSERQRKGRQAAHDARHWSWERSVDVICSRLEAICGSLPSASQAEH